MIPNLPIYRVEFSEDYPNIFGMALIDHGAMEVPFLAFGKETDEPMMFRVLDEDKHLVLGCIVRADFPILRKDKDGSLYYLVFPKEIVRDLARAYVANGNTGNFDLSHDHNRIVEGISLTQLYIKDVGKGIDPVPFKDVQDGSLFAEYRIESDEIWARVRKGEFRSLSLEGYFKMEPKAEPVIETLDDLLEYLKEKRYEN